MLKIHRSLIVNCAPGLIAPKYWQNVQGLYTRVLERYTAIYELANVVSARLAFFGNSRIIARLGWAVSSVGRAPHF